tara:strand:- start:461 stop:610 length:150 start_codon:yes stop_codon:yes gene_type:complete
VENWLELGSRKRIAQELVIHVQKQKYHMSFNLKNTSNVIVNFGDVFITD